MMPAGPRITAEEQIARHTVRSANGCLEWTGRRNADGYGEVYIHRVQKKAHRVNWEINNGPIPAGKLVLHKCDNPCCVDPNHLFVGTHKDNVQDMLLKKRAATGERAGNAKLTVTEVEAIRALQPPIRRTEIAHQYGISPRHFSAIRRGVSWRDLSACSSI